MSDQGQSSSAASKTAATWRKVIAELLDVFFMFFAAGFAVGYLTGNLTGNGFELHGSPAFLVFALIAICFFVFTEYHGGTLGQRSLGVE